MASTRIKIAGRLRPRLQGEISDDTVGVQKDDDGLSYFTVIHPRDNSQRFKFPFSSCYDHKSTQQEIYENDVKPLIDTVYSGVTVTVFAYGVTSSGKTHTIQGTKSDPGIIPRAVKDMFCRKEQIATGASTLFLSYMEIYKEEVYDLLVDRDNAPKLPVRENECGQVFVANLTHQPVDSVQEFEQLYSAATKRRTTGATNFNRASSRSHAILTISVQMDDPVANHTVIGKLNLVDLAGSENNKFTGNDPARMAESAAINKSLSVLGQVVHALNLGHSRVPYRNSKLTRILQDALGGSAVGLLICNLAPSAKFRQDTWNTLNFATRTKEIENKPVVNVRNNNPQKLHFAALVPPPTKQPSANLAFPALPTLSEYTDSDNSAEAPDANGSGGNSTANNDIMRAARRRGPRRSLIPGPMAPPKGRASSFGLGLGGMNTLGSGGAGFQSFGLLAPGPSSSDSAPAGGRFKPTGAMAAGITEEDIDERISRAVEAEVTRRLEAREREWEREKEELQVAKQLFASPEPSSVPLPPSPNTSMPRSMSLARPMQYDLSTASSSSLANQSQHPAQLPSGVLTPLLRRHRELDDELKKRLEELEQKYERDSKEAQLAEVLSPVSKKKTGRAYVALARAHSEKGNLEVALDLYRRAEAYVPDNSKLKERILEIEYSVKNGVEFKPEAKRKRKSGKEKEKKSRRKSRKDGDDELETTREDEHKELEDDLAGKGVDNADGMELDNNAADSADADVDGIAERVRRRRRDPFGEATNGSGSPVKRGVTPVPDGGSPKKRKTAGVTDPFVDNGAGEENVIARCSEVKVPRARSRSRSPTKQTLPLSSPAKQAVALGV